MSPDLQTGLGHWTEPCGASSGCSNSLSRTEPCLQNDSHRDNGSKWARRLRLQQDSAGSMHCGFFLAEADRLETRRRHASRHQIVVRGAGAAIAQSEIVLRGAAFVAMPLHHHTARGVILKQVHQHQGTFASSAIDLAWASSRRRRSRSRCPGASSVRLRRMAEAGPVDSTSAAIAAEWVGGDDVDACRHAELSPIDLEPSTSMRCHAPAGSPCDHGFRPGRGRAATKQCRRSGRSR